MKYLTEEKKKEIFEAVLIIAGTILTISLISIILYLASIVADNCGSFTRREYEKGDAPLKCVKENIEYINPSWYLEK